MRVATHCDDIDGIAAAALILRIYPDAEIRFLTVDQAKKTLENFDIVIDLPKPINAKINIDHHETNLERLVNENRLSPNDLVDPNAPSSTSLVAKYFDLNDEISKQLVELANKADTGNLSGETLILDKIIKYYVTDEKMLRKIAEVLATKGKDFLDDQFMKEVWEKIKRVVDEKKRLLDEKLKEVKRAKVKYLIAVLPTTFPYFIAKDLAYEFLKMGGNAVAVFYKDPHTGKDRVSIRVGEGCDIDARKLAEEIGGGGHKKAAGAIIRSIENATLKILEEFSKHGIVSFIKL